MIKPISVASPAERFFANLLTIAVAALALFQTLRGSIVSVKTKPATFAASGVSKTLASYWAAISFGVIVTFPIAKCRLQIEKTSLLTRNRKLAIGNRQSVLLVFRHDFFPALKDFAHHPLLRYGKYLQTIAASLLELFALHLGHYRQMSLRPGILNKFERVVFSEWMPFPVWRQQNPPQVRMIVKSHAKQIVNLALHPIRRRPDACYAVNARAFRN